MAANVTKSDIISAITLYIASNDEGRKNCPVNFLIDEKFGKQNKKKVLALVAELKEAGAIVGKRGRTGGLCFPDIVSVEASAVEAVDSETNDEASSAESTDDTDNAIEDDTIEQDGMTIERIPF